MVGRSTSRSGNSESPHLCADYMAGRLVADCRITILAMYSAQVLDHFQNPRGVGDLTDATVTAEVTNPACGDILRLSLQVRNGEITAARFRAKGCVPAIACGSALVEMLAAKPVSFARGLDRERLIRALGGLPPASTHASQLAIDALTSALKGLKP